MYLARLWTACVRHVINELSVNHQAQDLPRLWWIGTGLASSMPFHAAGLDSSRSDENAYSRILSSYAPSTRLWHMHVVKLCVPKGLLAHCRSPPCRPHRLLNQAVVLRRSSRVSRKRSRMSRLQLMGTFGLIPWTLQAWTKFSSGCKIVPSHTSPATGRRTTRIPPTAGSSSRDAQRASERRACH